MEVRIGGHDEPRRVGEIEIRGTSAFQGYWAKQDSDKAAFSDGWYRTGDLGYIADGELYVTGRSKDLIIHQGKNLYPGAMEHALGALSECKAGRVVVFGVEAEGTEDVVVMCEPELTSTPKREVIRAIRETLLGGFNVSPTDVVVVGAGELRKSTSGKIARSANRAAYLEGIDASSQEKEAAEPAPSLSTAKGSLLDVLRSAWASALNVPEARVGEETSLYLELGADSLTSVDVAVVVERALNRRIDLAVFRDDTIQRQAQQLSTGSGTGATLVLLQQGTNDQVPLFLLPVAQGLWAYDDLIKALGTDQTVYGVADSRLHCCVEHVAQEYAELIRAQGVSAYIVGGKCFGGTVAFETARQLEASGEEVLAVIMINVVPPHESRIGAWREKMRDRMTYGIARGFPNLARMLPSARLKRARDPENYLGRAMLAGVHFVGPAEDFMQDLEFLLGPANVGWTDSLPRPLAAMTGLELWEAFFAQFIQGRDPGEGDRFFPPNASPQQVLELLVRQNHYVKLQHYDYIPRSACEAPLPIYVGGTKSANRWSAYFGQSIACISPTWQGSPLYKRNVELYVDILKELIAEAQEGHAG